MTAPLSPLVVGGTDIGTMQSAVQLNKSNVTDPSHAARADRFWASGAALASDDTVEVLEISYASAGITNIISFDAVRFPHVISVEYSASTTDDWKPILDSVTGQPVEVEIMGSYPPVLNDPSTITGHFHPQHDYEGHWTRYDLTVAVAQVQKLRFLLQRQGGEGPLSVSGKPVPYSLALQNIDTGYRISQESDIPFHGNEADSDTSGQVFANSTDLFGSNLGFSKKTSKASNLLLNNDLDAPLIWKSEPQPNPNAVVNLYADMRDAKGQGQIIDQIFLDPLYIGPSINLYYSNDAASGPFVSSRTGLTSSQAVLSGASIRNDGPLSLGTWHPVDDVGNPAFFDPYYVSIDNFYLGFDPSLDWWMGMEWTRDWSPNTDPYDHDLFACDAFRIGQSTTSFYLSTSTGDTITLDNFTVDNEPIQIVAGYKAGLLHLTVQQGTETVDDYDQDGNFLGTIVVPKVVTVDLPASVNLPSIIPGQLVIGSTMDQSVFAGGQVTSFILSQSSLTSDDFINDPSGYSAVPLMSTDESKSKSNALLRFDTSSLGTLNATGFIGGPAHPYDQMTWTPIARTYEMQRGYMKLPATKAKFWNLEISNLRPENNEKFVPVTRQVKFFPPQLFNVKSTSQTAATTRQTDDDLALRVLQDLAGNSAFADAPQYRGTGDALSGITNTEVYVPTDTQTAASLSALGSQWNYQQLHPAFSAPRWSQVGVHKYVVETITQTSNVSYFAGLRNLVFAKTVKSAPQNLPIIEESFLNGDGIASGNWQTDDNGIHSGTVAGSSHAVSTSIVMPTQTGLRGLQFAAQQSDAQMIDIGGNFSDSTYDPTSAASWTAYGDGKIFGLDYNQSAGQHSLLVSRQSGIGFWADIALNWGATYGDLEAVPVTYGTLKGGSQSRSSSTGGVTSQSISAPAGGTLYAAVRATASESLSQPLYVQIVDADTGAVLSETQSNVSKNETKQWYAEIDVDSFGSSLGQSWGDLTNNRTWPSFSDTFTRADSSALGSMDSGQSWVTPTGSTSLSIASNAAVGNASARSEVNTGTPWGNLTIRFGAVATTTTHSAAVPLADLGGVYLMNDATILDKNLSTNYGSLGVTLATGHDYTFKFMLTSELGSIPGGVDATLQPYALQVLDGVTVLTTICTARAFHPTRALMGPSTTSYTKFGWVPSKEQVRLDNFISRQVAVTSTDLTDNGYNNYSMVRGSKTYQYSGLYSFDSLNLATRASSLRPGGNVCSPPTGLSISTTSTGGNFVSGTYYYKVTSTNQYGESDSSGTEVSVAVVPGGLVTLSWTADANAQNYNVYRGTSTGTETLLASSGNSTSFTDLGDDTNSLVGLPKYNTTNGAGTRQVTDVIDQYGALRINVTQMPSNMTASDVILAYLDYNPAGGQVLTLRGNGTIWNEITALQVGSIPLSPTGGPLSIHFVNKSLVSSTFKTAHPIANPTAILFFQNNTTYLGMYTAPTTWTSTVRGIGGANNGVGSTQYTIIEGFNWNPDGSSLATDTSAATWANVDYSSTRTFAEMTQSKAGSTQNLSMRIVQKGVTNDAWFIQSGVFFWDPVVWEFSCDSGKTWWEAHDIRNNPNGVLLFPPGLTAYNGLMWRLTSYAGRVSISHLAIRPWYVGQHGYSTPQPSHVPQGPNVIPYDNYAPIERDPRWRSWSRPVPHWWWDQGLATTK